MSILETVFLSNMFKMKSIQRAQRLLIRILDIII